MIPPDFAAIFELLPEPYMVLDRDLRFVAANAAYRRVTSSTLDTLLGRHMLEAFPHDADNPNNANARMLIASLERARDTGRVDTLAHIVYRVRRTSDGPLEERIWSASHTPITDAHGEVAYILQHTVDVTELHGPRQAPSATDGRQEQMGAGILRRAEDVQARNVVLDEERQHLRSLFQQAPGFVCVLRGPEHVIELANGAYHDLVGRAELEGRRLSDALPEVAGQGYFERLDEVFTTARTFVGRGMTVQLQRHGAAAPDTVVVDFVYQPILDAEGRVAGVFVQGNDITSQRRLEDELAQLLDRERAARADAESARAQAERANLLKDEFLATLSHELRTPLNALLGWARLLRGGRLPAGDEGRAAATIERNALALSQLVDDVLDLSGIVAGKLRLQLAPHDLCEVVRQAVETVVPAAQARRVTITVDDCDAVPITCDADRLQQVVWNLLSNAVKFTPPEGVVRVSLHAERDEVAVTVRDNGQGIDAGFLPFIFDRFRQAETAFRRQHPGLGVGLALVRQLVEAHGGSVHASSDGLGQGATFTVVLPRQAQALEGPQHAETAMPSAPLATQVREGALQGVEVLVVEDNPDALQLVTHLLQAASARVRTATTAADAIAAVRQDPPDVLVSDLGLPGIDGLDLIRELRGDGDVAAGRLPAIALTAYARASDRAHALEAGYQVHLSKPVSPPDLVAAIERLTAPRRTPQPPGEP